MNKPLKQLDEVSRIALWEIPETGMGYFVVTDETGIESPEHIFIITGDFFAVPVSHPEYFSISDLAKGNPFPSKPDDTLLKLKVKKISPVSSGNVQLPPGYKHAFGAIPLLGQITLQHTTNFYRYTKAQQDPCLNGSNLANHTYLTTANDITHANTGFGAVGRYALPLPVPASYQHLYQIDAGETLRIGTVLPNFGQAGGGVEVQLQKVTTVTYLGPNPIPDY